MSRDRVGRLRPADRALAAAIRAHGLVANGGVLHALEALSWLQRRAAAAGFRFFGLDGLAVLFDSKPSVPSDDAAAEALEEALNARYSAIDPSDNAVHTAFQAHYATAPEAYAPLDPNEAPPLPN